jgi:hypothetical protein
VVILLVLCQSFRLFGTKGIDIKIEMKGQDSVVTKYEKNVYVRAFQRLKIL